MKTTWCLVRLQLNEALGSFRRRGLLVNIGIISAILFGLYLASYAMAFFVMPYTTLGVSINTDLMTIVVSFLFILSFFLGISDIISTMYLSKENEILMSFPATSNEVFFSKVITIYVKELINNALFAIPLLVWYHNATLLGYVFYIHMIIYLLLFPLLVLVIAALISIPVMMFIRFIRTHPIAMIVTIVVVSGVVFLGYLSIVTRVSITMNIKEHQIESITAFNQWVRSMGRSLSLFRHLVLLLNGKDVLVRTGALLGLILVTGTVSILLIRPFYFRLAMAASETGQKKLRIVKAFKKESHLRSLIRKEFLSIFRNPSYVFQYFIFALLMPFVVIAYNTFIKDITVNQMGTSMIFAAYVLVLAIFTMLSNIISANMISLEGGNFYLIKTAPISLRLQMSAKVLFNMIITSCSVLVTIIFSAIFLDFNFFHLLISGIIILIAALGNICLNLEMDLRNPTLNWYGSEEIKSISGNLTRAIAYSFLWGIVLGCVMFFLAGSSIYIALFALLLVSLLFTLFRIYCLFFRTQIFLGRIEI